MHADSHAQNGGLPALLVRHGSVVVGTPVLLCDHEIALLSVDIGQGAISFCKRFPTPCATKSSFVQDEINLIPPKLDISFHSFAGIMNLSTDFSTSGAVLALFSGSHLHLNASICSHALAHDLKFRQI